MFSGKIGALTAIALIGLVTSVGANSYFSQRLANYFQGYGSGNTYNLYKYNIIPEAMDFVTYDNLFIFFQGFEVYMSDGPSLDQLANPPSEVRCLDDRNILRNVLNYTLLVLDLDSPQPDSPTVSPYLILFAANIPGNDLFMGTDLSNATMVAPWVQPNVPKGDHRIVFLLHSQSLEMENLNIPPISDSDRQNFDPRVARDMYALGEPIASNFVRVSPPPPTS